MLTLLPSTMRSLPWLILSVATICSSVPAGAADWSDTSIGWRTGNTFAEPFIDKDIRKNIVNLQHSSGYAYGSNFLNIDLLLSDSADPSSYGSSSGAQEVYVVYRHTLDLGKVLHQDLQWGLVRSMGITGGFDFNEKGDVGYNSKKRMLVIGPTAIMNVPGYLNISLLALVESNNPSVSNGAFDPGYPSSRYRYQTHPMLGLVWGVPIGALPLSFEGFANFIASKGDDELGRRTVNETNIDMQVMYSFTAARTFRAGLEYQYWKNKFGNSDATVGSLGGNVARTPMIRAEYHF